MTERISRIIDRSVKYENVKGSRIGKEIEESASGERELDEKIRDEVQGVKATIKFKLSQLTGNEAGVFRPDMTPEEVTAEMVRISTSKNS